MRPIERINNFLNLVDWGKLANRWNITFDFFDQPSTLMKIGIYWINNPDQRIGQVLINLNLIDSTLGVWIDEESEILLNQGIAPEDCLYWTSIYNKDGNLLDEPVSKLLKDLDTDHILNIYKYVYIKNNKTLSDTYDLAFNNILIKREVYKELEEIKLINKFNINHINEKI